MNNEKTINALRTVLSIARLNWKDREDMEAIETLETYLNTFA